MKISGLDFPNSLLEAIRRRDLVVFAGAGVSMGEPASLPDFKNLAKSISYYSVEDFNEKEPEDQFLGRLHDSGKQVHALAAQLLTQSDPQPTSLHTDLLRLYRNPKDVRIVTTNFDTLFEQAACDVFGRQPEISVGPTLPLGRETRGIVHVHGSVEHIRSMVLTDKDFGRAYLTDGWAQRFLVELFRSFTVLFVGYSHSDVVMNYLSRALPPTETKGRFIVTEKKELFRPFSVEVV